VTTDAVVRKIVDAVSVVFDLLNIYGYEESNLTQHSFTKTVKHWSDQTVRMSGDWIGYLKFRVATFAHYHTPQTVPAPKKPAGLAHEIFSSLLVGHAERFIQLLLRGDHKIEFISSIAIGVKKGMPRPDESYLLRGLAGSFNSLTTPRPSQMDGSLTLEAVVNWADLTDEADRSSRRFDDMLCRRSSDRLVDRTVGDLFSGVSYDAFLTTRTSRPFPSTSSTNSHTRSQGGGFAALQEVVEELGLFRPKLPLVSFFVVEKAFDVEAEDLMRITLDDTDQSLRENFVSFWADPSELNASYDILYEHCQGMYERGELDNIVDIVALAEPLKVRTITKGNAIRNFLLAPLQNFLWGRLSTHKIFKLIGTPITAEIVEDTIGRNLRAGEKLLSGDYSKATDDLAPWFSNCIARHISEQCALPEWLSRLFLECLTGHMIRDPGDKHHVLPQRWGQLMGSLVSFPVLCIANLIVCRWAVEASKFRRIPLDQLSMLVNGDDCLFKLKETYFRVWVRVAAYHGLTPSVGKVIFSDTVAQMNSVNFIYDELAERKFTRVPFVNMGLYYGLGRSSGSLKLKSGRRDTTDTVQVDDILAMPSRARDLLIDCPPRLRVRIYSQYLAYHRPKLMALAGKLPWFVPSVFGGVGLPVFAIRPADGTPHVTTFDKLLMQGKIFLSDGSAQASRWTPTDQDIITISGMIDRGACPGVVKTDTSLPIRQAATKYLPCRSVYSELEYDSDAANALVCLQVLFREKLSVSPKKDLAKIMHRRSTEWLKQQKRPGLHRGVIGILALVDKIQLPIFTTHVNRPRTPFAQLPTDLDIRNVWLPHPHVLARNDEEDVLWL